MSHLCTILNLKTKIRTIISRELSITQTKTEKNNHDILLIIRLFKDPSCASCLLEYFNKELSMPSITNLTSGPRLFALLCPLPSLLTLRLRTSGKFGKLLSKQHLRTIDPHQRRHRSNMIRPSLYPSTKLPCQSLREMGRKQTDFSRHKTEPHLLLIPTFILHRDPLTRVSVSEPAAHLAA